MPKLLVVDDNKDNLKATQKFLSANKYEVEAVTNAHDALECLKKNEYAVALLDFHMPDMMGDALAAIIRKDYPNQQITMFSCDETRSATRVCMKAGAYDFIEKKNPKELLAVVTELCKRYEEELQSIRVAGSKSENRKIIESVKKIGESEIMATVAMKLHKFAQAPDTSVLILGESGTGKEVAARAIHDLSTRSRNNFVAINCAAIPKDLLESELFGHRKGSFTGATADKMGKFEYADGGTIFLDEIGDMSIELQAKLLRVLQEREVTPVGARLSKKINVRVICATHRNLEEKIKQGLFREDLYYRIKVVHVEIPPLRARVDDIEPLIAFFTEKYNKAHGTRKYFQRRTLDVLKKYAWPGNIRELQGLVEKQLILATESLVRPEDLEMKVHENQAIFLKGMTLEEYRNLKDEEFTQFLLTTLEEAGGNKTEAGKRLGITDSHLRHLLKGKGKSLDDK